MEKQVLEYIVEFYLSILYVFNEKKRTFGITIFMKYAFCFPGFNDFQANIVMTKDKVLI